MHRLAMTHSLPMRGHDHLVQRVVLFVANRYRRNLRCRYLMPLAEMSRLTVFVLSVDGSTEPTFSRRIGTSSEPA